MRTGTYLSIASALCAVLLSGVPQATAAAAGQDNPEFHYQVALAALRDGNLDIALRELDRAAILAPDNALVQYNLGIVNQKKGRTSEALRNFREAIRLGLPPELAKTANELLPSLTYENEKILDSVRSLKEIRGHILYAVCRVDIFSENSHFEGAGCDLTLVVEMKTGFRTSDFQRTSQIPMRLRNIEKTRMDPTNCSDGSSLGHYFGLELTLAGETAAAKPGLWFDSPVLRDSVAAALEKVAASCRSSR